MSCKTCGGKGWVMGFPVEQKCPDCDDKIKSDIKYWIYSWIYAIILGSICWAICMKIIFSEVGR